LESWKDFKFDYAANKLTDEFLFKKENKALTQKDKDRLERFELYLELKEEFKDR
jgi:hypothetical protein